MVDFGYIHFIKLYMNLNVEYQSLSPDSEYYNLLNTKLKSLLAKFQSTTVNVI